VEPDTHISTLYYAYLDESGDVTPFSGSRYLVVAVLIARNPRPIELHVKRARKSLGRKARPDELKASRLETAVVERLLIAIADEDIEIVAVIVDKQAILRPPTDPEDIYREAVTRVVRHCVKRHPRLECFLDKRYTKSILRDQLERVIRSGIADVTRQVVLLRQEDSRKHRGLQAVDHVAWAFFQKYERGAHHFWELIRHRVVVEEIVEHHLW
jgi:hypothetical protein